MTESRNFIIVISVTATIFAVRGRRDINPISPKQSPG